MNIMRYTVSNMQEGMALIRKEMGPSAVIIESKKKRVRGFLGFFLPKQLEITAAVDTNGTQQDKKNNTTSQRLINGEIDEIKANINKILARQENSMLQGDGIFHYWLHRLLNNDVHREYAVEIIHDIQNMSGGKHLTMEVMEALISIRVQKAIITTGSWSKHKFIAFVGPTGVGKTTTLAKLAAHFAFHEGKRTAIITVDTYRIGAVEQLKAYTQITGIPLEVVYTLNDMKQAVEKYQDYDLVLVDTAGRSSKNTLQIAETAQFINCLKDSFVFLIISATTKPRDVHKISLAFKRVNYNALILTKLDETETYGTILNACKLTALPIAYLTTGQNVPEDIEPADAARLAGMVLGDD